MTQPPQDNQMNREQRRMSSKMGYDPENQRAQTKKAATKSRKPASSGPRVSIFVKIITFFKEAWRELKKVSWPTKKEVLNSTIVVLVCLLVVTLLILGVDYGAERLADLVYS
jgi:preprotein translocase subunit SecE